MLVNHLSKVAHSTTLPTYPTINALILRLNLTVEAYYTELCTHLNILIFIKNYDLCAFVDWIKRIEPIINKSGIADNTLLVGENISGDFKYKKLQIGSGLNFTGSDADTLKINLDQNTNTTYNSFSSNAYWTSPPFINNAMDNGDMTTWKALHMLTVGLTLTALILHLTLVFRWYKHDVLTSQ